MKNIICITILIFPFMLSTSCGLINGKGEAEKVAESMFEDRINNSNFISEKYYSELFWKNTDQKKFSNIKKLVMKAMGNLNSYSLKTWNVQSNVNMSDVSGIFVVLIYDTEYEKGKGTEKLTFHKPLVGKKFLIVGHNFNSDKIQNLLDKGIEKATSSESL